MPKTTPDAINPKKKFGGFAQLIRKPINGKNLQWALGALIALVVDVQARAENAPDSAVDGLDDSKIQYSVVDADGLNISATSDSSLEGESDYRQVLVQDSGSRPELPTSLRKLLVDIASASPADSARLLEEIRANVVAQARLNKTSPADKQATVTVKGADGVTEGKTTTISLDSDGEVYKAIRQAALDYENGQLGKGFAVTSAELNAAIPLQFVDENDQEILWAKEDSINPLWYFSPLGLLGLAGGGGGGGAAAAVAQFNPGFMAGFLLEDAISDATVLLEFKQADDSWLAKYSTTSGADGSFSFNGITAEDIAAISNANGNVRVHGLGNGIDSFSKATVGEFFLNTFGGKFATSGSYSQTLILDPISTISSLTGVSQAALKAKLFGDPNIVIAPNTLQVDGEATDLQDGVRQIYALLRSLTEVQGGLGSSLTLSDLTNASSAFVKALEPYNVNNPAIIADRLDTTDSRLVILNEDFIGSAVLEVAKTSDIRDDTGLIARITIATIDAAQQVTNTGNNIVAPPTYIVEETTDSTQILRASGFLSAYLNDNPEGLTSKQILDAENLFKGQQSFIKEITFSSASDPQGINETSNLGNLSLVSNGNDQYYAYDVKNSDIAYLHEGQTRVEQFTITLYDSDEFGNKLTPAVGSFTQSIYIKGYGFAPVFVDAKVPDPTNPDYSPLDPTCPETFNSNDGYTISYNENTLKDVVIGQVHATDADTSSSLTYTIESGDNLYLGPNNTIPVYEIDPVTGEITLTDEGAKSFADDFERTENTHIIHVTASDGQHQTSIKVTLKERDLNDNSPVFVDAKVPDPTNPDYSPLDPTCPETFNSNDGYTISYNENTLKDVVIGQVHATDADTSSSLTYTIESGDNLYLGPNNTIPVYEIDPVTGEITLTDEGAKSFADDFERTENTHIIHVTASDGKNTNKVEVTLTELDVPNDNESPIARDDDGYVDEDATLDVDEDHGVIKSIEAPDSRDTDPDIGDTLKVVGLRTGPETNSVGATDGSVGSPLAGTYGSLTLREDGSYVYVANNADSLAQDVIDYDYFTYTVSDGHGGTDTAQLKITLKGTNDRPIIFKGEGDRDQASLFEPENENENEHEDEEESSENSSDDHLYASGTLTVNDLDRDDPANITVTDLQVSGTFADSYATTYDEIPWSIEGFDPFAMLTFDPANEVADYVGSTNNIHWIFDSATEQGTEAFDFLAEGETLALTYTIRATDTAGEFDSYDITITITGTNDDPVISVLDGDLESAQLVETHQFGDTDESSSDSYTSLTASGSLSVTDVDLSDTVSLVTSDVEVSSSNPDVLEVLPSEEELIALMTVAPATDLEANLQARNNVEWSFDSQEQAFDYLADGETLTLTYTITATDGHGGSATQDIIITITGTDDAPVIDSDVGTTGAVLEFADETDSETSNEASGTLSFFDDASDIRDVTIADTAIEEDSPEAELAIVSRMDNGSGPQVVAYYTLAEGSSPVALEEESAQYQDILSVIAASQFTTDGAELTLLSQEQIGQINWHFTVPADASLDFLAKGEQLQLVYTVQLTSAAQDGAEPQTTTQEVTITITGTNDEPVIEGGDDSIAITEEVTPLGHFTQTGSLSFADVDLTDHHAVRVIAPEDAFGELTAHINTDTTNGLEVGEIVWSYRAAYDQMEYLAEGETLEQTFTVELDDGNGGIVTKEISLTITGTNDAPLIDTTVLQEQEIGASLSASGLLVPIHGLDVLNKTVEAIGNPPPGQDSSYLTSMLDLKHSRVGSEFFVHWAFDSQAETFDYLALEESIQLTLSYEVANAPSLIDDISNAINGVLAFSDLDVTDVHEDPVVEAIGGSVGEVYFDQVTAANGGVGSVAWHYEIDWPNSGLDPVELVSEGYSWTESFLVTITDSEGATATKQIDIIITGSPNGPVLSTIQEVSVIITGTNDTPVIEVVEYIDSIAADFIETDAGLSTSGTLTVTDLDLSDTVSFSTTLNVQAPHVIAGALPSHEALLGMFTTDAVIDATPGDAQNLTWTFNSDTQAFNYLAEGETLTLTYTITATDSSLDAATDTQEVTITITGTNDVPVISTLGEGDAFGATIDEENSGLAVAGTITIEDLDLSDTVAITVDPVVQIAAPESVLSVLPSVAEFFAMFAIDANTQATPGDYSEVEWSFDSQELAFDYLAQGETLTLTYTITATDSSPDGASTTQDIVITITGTNDAPVIEVVENVDSIAADFIETDAGLTASGTLSVTDLDLSDSVSFATTEVAIETTNEDVLEFLPSEAELIAMMSTDPVSGLEATPGDAQNLTWTFNSDTQAFNYLAEGETLTLTYTITATDSSPDTATDTQEVTITITGTNDVPVISLEEGDVAVAALTEEDGTLLSEEGSITIADIDLSDDVALSVEMQVSAPDSIQSILPSYEELFAMLQIDPITAATPNEANNVAWSFDSQEQAFDYLADGETITLTYTVTADDGHGGIVTQDIVVTITGTDDVPAIDSDIGTTAEFVEFADVTASEEPQTTSGTLSFFDDVTDYREVLVADSSAEDDEQAESAIVSRMGNGSGPQVVAYYSLADGNGPVELEGDSEQYQYILNVIAGSSFVVGLNDAFYPETQEQIGQINWNFTIPADASLDFLAEGEQLQLVYTVQLTSAAQDGAEPQTTTQEVTITITGTNDVPVISLEEGDVAVAALTEEDETLLSEEGSITIADIDLSDDVALDVQVQAAGPDGVLAVLPSAETLVAMLQIDPITAATPNEANNVEWSFDSQEQAFDYLADGETLTLTYTITATDGHGGSATQDIIITITGTDDAPVIDSDVGTTGAVLEFADETDSETSNEASGTLSFFDDASDIRDVTIADTAIEEDSPEAELAIVSRMDNGSGPQVVAYYTLAEGSSPVALEEESAQYQDILSVIAASQFTTDGAELTLLSQEQIGQINWHFTVPADASLDFLAKGEQLQLVYTVQLTSAAQDGAEPQTTTQEVTITITGTNDEPVIEGGDDSIAITEEVTPLGHFTQTGSLSFADVDLTDHHAVRVIAPEDAFGELTAHINTDTTNGLEVGEIVWSYRAAYDQMEYLAEGETLEQTFTVELDDGNGGIVTKEISLTITGTNDAPLIDTTVLQEQEIGASLSAHSSLTIKEYLDASLHVNQTGVVVADGSVLPDDHVLDFSGMFTTPSVLYPLGLGSNPDQPLWSFDSADGETPETFDYLALGETLTLVYGIELTTTPHVYKFLGVPYEILPLTHVGQIDFTDLDISDAHTVQIEQMNGSAGLITFDEGVDNGEATGQHLIWHYTANPGEIDPNYDALSSNADLTGSPLLDSSYSWTESFLVTITDSEGATATKQIDIIITGSPNGPVLSTIQEVSVIITGTNDTPVIEVVEYIDSIAADFIETDAGLSTSGTLTVTDLDLSDTVSFSTTLNVQAPHVIAGALPSHEALLGMFTTDAVIDATPGDAQNLTWTFNSDTQAFNYLAEGETLTLTYTITATDSSLDAATDTQEVTITITGTNDVPVISTLGEGDAFGATIDEENSGLAVAGTITIEDLDLSDTVAITVDPVVQIAAPESVLSVLPSVAEFFAMFAIDANTQATPGDYSEVEWSFDSQELAFDYLAQGETLTLTYTITATDSSPDGASTTQDIVITITGTNDAPVIEVVENVDSIAADFIETDAGLTASGTLSVTDLDLSDSVSFATTEVAIETTNEDVLEFLPSEAELIAMMSTDPVSGLEATPGDAQNLTWTFNSDTQAFNYLAEGETLTLTYTITATDSSPDTATDTQEVTITITGTNDVPVISLEEGDVAVAALTEEDGTLLSEEGSITIADIDLSDDVALGVQVQAAGPDGVLAVLPSAETLVAMLQIDPITAATPNEANNVAWSFDSQGQAFDFLAQGETLTLTYTITATDSSPDGASTTQDIVITITGTNDAPVIEVVENVDSIAADFIETDAGLTASGTLSVTDLDLSDSVSFATTEVAIETTNEDVLEFLPSEAELIAMMSTDPVSGLEATPGDAQNLTWTFNSDTQAFNYLAEGETLTLTYTITATDSSPDTATDTQEVTITITGTNDVPVISLEEGDVAVAALTEEDGTLLSEEGSITIADIDLSDDVALGVQVQAAGPDGVLAVLPSAETLVAMLQIDPITAATPNEANNVAWSFDSQGQAFDFLAQDETLELTYTVTADDGHGGIVTQDIVITITGTNDAPVIEVVENVDSIAADFIETDAGLTASGTLSVTDLDLSDSVSFATTEVAIETTNEDVLEFLPSEAELIAMMSTDPVSGLEATPGDAQNLTWTFNSDTQAFNYLAEGETLTLTYTITATDSSPDTATDTQEVTITITGTNDVPVISLEEGDVAVAALTEEDGTLLSEEGSITIADIDLSDDVALGVQVQAAGPDGVLAVLPNVETLVAMLQIDPITAATPNEANNVAWSFDSQGQAFDFLAQDETLELTYTVTADDGHGGIVTQDIVITITGTNDAPVIEVVENVDSIAADFIETDAGLTVSGTLSVTDLDLSDSVSFATTEVAIETTNEDVLEFLPSEAELIAMMSTNPVSGLEATPGDAQNLTWTFNSDTQAFNYLAEGETLTLTYTITATDSSPDTATDTQEVTITITGTNDVPVISLEEGDVAVAALTEENEGLTTEGTITIIDLDVSDDVALGVQVQAAGPDGVLAVLPNVETLVAMLQIDPITAATPNEANNVAWSFDSQDETFDYLAEGETLTLTYTITATDSSPDTATDTQEVTITITGTNDVPVISLEEGDVAVAALTEEDGTLLSEEGSITIADIDLSDDVALGVQVQAAGPDGVLAVLPNVETLVAMLQIDPITAATPNEANNVAWSFDSQGQAFDFLAQDETLELTYTVTADDGHGGIVTQDIVITITGTNDAPVIEVVENVDSIAADFIETDAGLTVSGTLSVTDLDLSDSVSFATTEVAIETTNEDVLEFLPSEAELIAMMSTNPVSGLEATPGDAQNLTWTFNSDTQAFNYLAEGETLTLTYTITATDSSPDTATDTQEVTITITGTNDVPELSFDVVNLVETDSASDLNASGTLTIADLDHGQSIFIAQEEEEGEYGTFSVDENGNWTYVSSSAHNEFLAGQTYTDTFDVYSFDGTKTTVTINIDGTSSTITDAYAHSLVEAGDLALNTDNLTVEVSTPTLLSSLKDLQALAVDAVALSGEAAQSPVINVNLGEGEDFDGGLTAGLFDPSLTVNVDLTEEQIATDLEDLSSDDAIANLQEAGIDQVTINVNDNADLDALLLSNPDTLDQLEALDHSGLATTIDAGGRDAIASATASDALAHHLAGDGIDFAHADELTVIAEGSTIGTHMQTSLKELQKLGVDSVLLSGATLDNQVDVTLGEGDAFAGGLTDGMFDTDPAISFNLELDQEQLGDDLSALVDDSAVTQNLVDSGLDTVSVNLEDGVNLDDILDNSTFENLQSLDQSLNVTLDVGGRTEEGSATASDALAHHLAEDGIDFAQADELTVIAEGNTVGTHMQTSLKELQKLGVDSVLLSGATLDNQVDVTLGEGDAFAGGLTDGMFDTDPAISFNLELDQEQLGDDLSALVDDSAVTQNLVDSGLDTVSVNLEDGVNLDDILDNSTFENLQSLDQHLNVTLDVGGRTEEGSATASDALAHHLAQDGIDFAQADELTVIAEGQESVGTHLQTSLKELQKLGVDHIAIMGGEGGQVDVTLGEGDAFAGGLTDGMFDTDPAISFNLELDQEQLGDDLSALVDDSAVTQNLVDSGLDTVSVNLEDGVNLDDILDNSTFENLQSLDQSLNVTLDVGGRTEEGSATASDALAHHLAQDGIDFAQADELTVIADGTVSDDIHLQTSLKELDQLGVDIVSVDGESDSQLMVDLGYQAGESVDASDLARFDDALDVTLDMRNSGIEIADLDAATFEALMASGIDRILDTNDGPIIANNVGDTLSIDVAETNDSLTTSGTISVSDADLFDVVSIDVLGVQVVAPEGITPPSEEDLLAMFAIDEQTTIHPQEANNIAWSFDSQDETFDYLAQGESLTLTYTVLADDGQGGTTTQEVTITITGTNDVPVISLEEGDVAVAALTEEDGTLLSEEGSITIADIDLSDDVALGVQVQAAGPDGVLAVLPSAETLVAMLQIDPITAATPNEANNVAWSFDSQGQAFDFLAQDETLELTYTVTADDGHGGIVTQDIVITITGTNDAPVIEVVENVDSIAADFIETDAGLTASGTLSVTDLDLSDSVSFATTEVAIETTNEDVLEFLPSEAELIAMMSTDPVSGLEATPGDAQNLTWTFNSDTQAFNYLAEGETLTLTYTITATDSSPDTATDTQEVTITITGTNDVPVISLEEGDVAVAALTEEDGTLLSEEGSITIADIDLSDDVALGVQVQAAGPDGVLAVLPSAETLVAMLQIDPITAATPNEANNVAWSFDSQGQAFDFLAQDETLELTYTVTADDGHGGIVTQDIVITITGTNDAPVIEVVENVDSIAADFIETDAGLTASGTLSVTDLDLSDSVSFATTEVAIETTNEDVLEFLPSEAELIAMMSTDPVSGLEATPGDAQNLTWTFNSDTQAFNYLAEGETLTLTYTITATDSSPDTATDTQEVTITITGTNDVPELSFDVVNLVETDSASDLNASGTLTIADLDHGQSIFIAQEEEEGEYGTFSVDENGNWTYVSSSAHNEFLAGQTYTDTFDVYSFDGTKTTVTINIDGTSSTITDAYAHSLVEAGDLALNTDNLTVEVSTPTLLSSLKDLQALAVDAVALSGEAAQSPVINVNLGEGEDFDGGLTAGLFDPSLTVNVDLTEEQIATDLEDLSSDDAIANLQEAGIDQVTINVNDNADLDALLLSNPDTLDQLEALDHSGLATTIDAGGRDAIASATASDALAHHLAGDGIDFAHADELTVIAEGSTIGTHMQTSLKELQKLGVDSVLLSGATLDNQVDVTLGEGDAFAGGLTDGMFDTDPAISFNLELDQEQLGDDLSALVDDSAVTQNLVDSGLDTVSVNLEDGVNLDDILDNSTFENLQSLDQSLNVTLDVGGRTEEGSATASDALAHHLAQDGIDFAQADELTVIAEGQESVGTHLQTSLKELQKLGVDHIAIMGGEGGQVDVTLGEGDAFAGGLTDGMFDTDPAISFNLELDQEQLGDDLSALVDDSAVTQNLVDSGLDTVSVNLEDGVNLDDILDNSTFENLQSLDQSLNVTLDVGGRTEEGSATASDALAHHLAQDGIDFAQADQLTVFVPSEANTDPSGNTVGTHLQTSLKELQKLGVDTVLLAGEVIPEVGTKWVVDLGDGSWAPEVALPLFGDLDGNGQLDDTERAAFDITLNIESWSDLGNGTELNQDLIDALHESGIDNINLAVSLENLVGQTGDWISLAQTGSLNNAGLHYVQAIVGSLDMSELPVSFEQALSQEIQVLDELSAQYTAEDLSDGIQSIGVLGQYTTPEQFGALVSALSESGVADFVVDSGSVEISDPLAAALVDAGMLQALPQANLVIDATHSHNLGNSYSHLFTSLKALADLGVDHVNTDQSLVYINLGLPVDDADLMADIKAILDSLDPANQAKSLFGDGQHGALVIDNATAVAINGQGGLTADMIESLTDLGIDEIKVLADTEEGGELNIIDPAVAQTQLPLVEVQIIGHDTNQALHDDLQPHIPAPR